MLTDDELKKLLNEPWKIARTHLTDEEHLRLQKIEQQRFREIGDRLARLRIEEQPLVADLRREGFDVNSVWDLVNRSEPYPSAIPVLVKHLSNTYSDRITEGIASALAVPDARSAWPLLVAKYRYAREGYEDGFLLGAKGGLAAALSVTATEAVLDELVELARDRSNGESRRILLKPFRRFKSEAARRALTDLAADPEIAKEIASWTKRKRKPRS